MSRLFGDFLDRAARAAESLVRTAREEMERSVAEAPASQPSSAPGEHALGRYRFSAVAVRVGRDHTEVDAVVTNTGPGVDAPLFGATVLLGERPVAYVEGSPGGARDEDDYLDRLEAGRSAPLHLVGERVGPERWDRVVFTMVAGDL